MNSKEHATFTIVHGDLPLSPGIAGGDFVMAEATDTRLMGVVGLHVLRRQKNEDFHQLFYLDFEEYGLDEYRSYHIINDTDDYMDLSNNQNNVDGIYSDFDDDFPEIISRIEDVERDMADLFGGLGGVFQEITEEEAIFLIKDAVSVGEKYDVELPEGIEEYGMILDSPLSFGEDEKSKLWRKICITPDPDYEVINYFIMRHAAMDIDGRDYLGIPEQSYNMFVMTEPGTLYRNETKSVDEGKNSLSLIRDYYSTSLISDDTGFRLITANISVAGPKVISYDLIDDMRITPWESRLILARNEYVSYAKLKGKTAGIELAKIIRSLYPKAESHPHPKGNLFMLLSSDNSHAAKRIYRLDDDVCASIYIRFNGEILVAGSDLEQVHFYERLIENIAETYRFLYYHVERYSFPESTLGYYVREDYGEFNSFLEYLQFLTSNQTV